MSLASPPSGPVWWVILDRDLVLLRRVLARTAHQAWQMSNLPLPFSSCIVRQMAGRR